MKVEADRFQRLKYTPEQFKTEAKAVKGEYDKNSANPFSKMFEVLRETAFKKHTYSHTTMGYLKDIEDMPNQYDYSKQFFSRFYRPEYSTIVVVGDITRERALDLTKKYWGTWQRGSYKADISEEPEQKESRTAHIPWDAPTLPHLVDRLPRAEVRRLVEGRGRARTLPVGRLRRELRPLPATRPQGAEG